MSSLKIEASVYVLDKELHGSAEQHYLVIVSLPNRQQTLKTLSTEFVS